MSRRGHWLDGKSILTCDVCTSATWYHHHHHHYTLHHTYYSNGNTMVQVSQRLFVRCMNFVNYDCEGYSVRALYAHDAISQTDRYSSRSFSITIVTMMRFVVGSLRLPRRGVVYNIIFIVFFFLHTSTVNQAPSVCAYVSTLLMPRRVNGPSQTHRRDTTTCNIVEHSNFVCPQLL